MKNLTKNPRGNVGVAVLAILAVAVLLLGGIWASTGQKPPVQVDQVGSGGKTVTASATAWGSITGTLSAQTDLQAQLDLKANLAGPTFSGIVTAPNASTTNLSVLTKASFGSTATSSFNSAGVLTLITALGLSSGGTNASLSGANQLLHMNSGNTAVEVGGANYTLTTAGNGLLTVQNASTTQLTATGELVVPQDLTAAFAGELTVDNTTGQLRYFANSRQNVLSAFQYPSVGLASSTMTGTTTPTVQIGPRYVAETWASVVCSTDVGTVDVQFYNNGLKILPMIIASSTMGTTTLTSNNVLPAGAVASVDFGTPATSPTKVSCTIKKSYNAD